MGDFSLPGAAGITSFSPLRSLTTFNKKQRTYALWTQAQAQEDRHTQAQEAQAVESSQEEGSLVLLDLIT